MHGGGGAFRLQTTCASALSYQKAEERVEDFSLKEAKLAGRGKSSRNCGVERRGEPGGGESDASKKVGEEEGC